MNQTQKDTLKTYLKTVKEGPAAKRALAVVLLEAGADVTLTGYTVKHAQRLRREFCSHGEAAFDDKRKSNRERILTKPERGQVVLTLKTKQPADLWPGAGEHWTTGLLARYIFETTGKKYKSKTSHYLLFKEASFSFHMPGKSYEKHDSVAVAAWCKRQVDGRGKLRRAWYDPHTVILAGDEMILTSATTMQKIWLPKGQYPPVVETNRSRKRKSIYGFLSLKTGTEHAYVTDYQNMHITAEVLTKLRAAYPDKKLLLIWDNCGWHKGSKVVEWMKQDRHTDVIWFPAYAPELNPQEHVWKAGRRAVTHNQHITDLAGMVTKFVEHITGRCFRYELCGLRAPKSAQD